MFCWFGAKKKQKQGSVSKARARITSHSTGLRYAQPVNSSVRLIKSERDMKRVLVFFIKAVVANALMQPALYAADSESYIDTTIPFVNIEDVNRESEVWATCAATYDIMAEIFEGTQPAQAKQLHEMANGAELAVTMAMVSDGIDDDISPEKFNALWAYSKVAGQEIPKTKKSAIMADAEILGKAGKEVFFRKLTNTAKVCTSNIEAQQAYIDMWRELAKSGLLKFE